jgi:hypothetical protein
MKQTFKLAAAFFLSAALAFAGTIKTWGTHDVLTAADLNANFQHIHNTMVGGHGARLVDADVAGNAAIATSKLAAGKAGLPLGWGYFKCGTGTCATSASNNASVSRTSTGAYVVTVVGYSGPGAVLLTTDWKSDPKTYCQPEPDLSDAGTSIYVDCFKIVSAGSGSDSTSTAVDADFRILALDN